jgi:hypothetical protein
VTFAALAVSMLVLAAAPPPKGRAPPASETAKLYFLAGDLAKAQEWARQGIRREPKLCRPLVKRLAEYAWLAGKSDDLDVKQARQVLELDRAISPSKPGKLTERVIERFITRPMEIADLHAQQGHSDSARVIARQVLEVDPSNARARALAEVPVEARDAGQ